MKTYTTSGTGGGQTLTGIETDKIPVYNSREDVTADLANLSVGQIVATKDTGNELAQPVDVVEEDNLHAVTSNAVFENCPRIPDYARGNLFTAPTNTYTATEDCYVQCALISSTTVLIKIDGVEVGCYDSITNAAITTFNGYLKKGQTITINVGNGFAPTRFKVFGLIGA